MIERALCPILVGREAELSALDDALLDAAQGEARVVALAGDAGLGKTRLAVEMRRRAQRLGYVVLWGGCSEAGLAVPYLPFAEALGNHLGRVDVAALRTRLGQSARELASLFPQLGVEPVAVAGDDPRQSRLRLFEAVITLLDVVADGRPLAVVVEDVHWADGSTRELLDYAVRRLVASPVMLLVTYRREEMNRGHPLHPTLQGWRRARLASTIELDPLPAAQVAEMVCAILDEPQLSDEFRDYLHRRSDGHPFVLEEMLKEAVESGDVFRSDAGWDRKSIGDLRIPATVRDTILSRLERLDSTQREVLRRAAVIGAVFDTGTLADVSRMAAADLDDVLHVCAQQQFLEEAAEAGTFRFHHSLTREAIYNDLSAAQRARIHDQVAAVMEERGLPASQRATHVAGAGHVADAVPLWIQAADEAERRHAYADAAELYERALAHVDDVQLRARTHGAAGRALWAGGGARITDAIRHLEACVAGLEEAGCAREAASHRLLLGRCHWSVSDGTAARREYATALQVLEPFGSGEDVANAYLRLGAQEGIDCRWDEAEPLLRRAIELAAEAQADAPRIGANLWIAAAVLERDIDAGLALYQRTCQEAEDRDLDFLVANALANNVVAHLDVVRARECLPLLDRLRQRERGGWATRTTGLEGGVHICLGDAEAAVRILTSHAASAAPGDRNVRDVDKFLAWGLAVLGRGDEAMRHAVRPNLDYGNQDAVFVTIAWARLHLARGTPDQALPAVDELLDHFDGLPPWRVHGPHDLADCVVAVLVATGNIARAVAIVTQVEARDLTWSPYGKRAKARALLASGDHAGALVPLRTALAEFEDAGYRLDVAETRVLLARALQGTGDVSGAQREARTALDEARLCKAPYLVDMARAALADAGGDAHPADGPAAATTDGTRGPSGAVVVVALAGDDRAPPVLQWAQRNAAGRGAEVVADSAAARVSFDGATQSDQRCIDAVRFALMLHDRALLADAIVAVGIGMSESQARKVANGDTVTLSGAVHQLLQSHHGDTPPRLRVEPAGQAGSYAVRRSAGATAMPVEPAAIADVFRRDGEYWTVAFGGSVVRIRDSKGMRDLATLLAHPAREVAAVDLVSGATTAATHSGSVAAASGLGRQGDAGPVLDDEARRQYRERLVDLEEEIGAAENDNDPERAAALREEREFLLAELGAAVGLGGRSRRMLDPAERARKTVTWRIRDAISRIAKADAAIGEHFRRSVRTGAFCVYDPPHPSAWQT